LESAKSSEFVIFADNCRVHHSKKVAEFLKDNQIEIIFNVPYAPEYNPIERVWSKIKLCFKKARLSTILDGNTPNFEKLLRKILNEFPQEKVRSICHGTYRSKLAQ
jgi:transposase